MPMIDSASNQFSSWSWATEAVNIMFASAQPQTHWLSQDAELLSYLNFVPGLKEILMLRQVHALEHATVWILSDTAQARGSTEGETLGGMSTDRGFYLYGQVNSDQVNRAVRTALRRITSGDWELAVHPRCGTNLSVGIMLTAGLALGAFTVLPRGPVEQALGLGAAVAIAAQLTPNLGNLAQRHITTAIPFNLLVDRVTSTQDYLGRSAHFVQVHWVD